MVDAQNEHEDENEVFAIRAMSGYFSSLLQLIPTKYYVHQSEEIDKKTKKKNKQPLNKKLLGKKAKLYKLDPSNYKSSAELQLEIELKEKELMDNEDLNDVRVLPLNGIGESKPLEELREKLHDKVALLTSKRNKAVQSESDKNKTRKRRVETKSKDELVKKKKKLSESIKRVNDIESKSLRNSSEIEKSDSKVVFSKFDFVTASTDIRKKKKSKTKEQLLEIAEKKDVKLNELEKTDSEKAKEIRKNNAWSNAMKKAEGIKLKDDTKLLKKSIRKKEDKKKHSKKKWDERIETVKNQKEEKQKLRQQNIKQRNEAKKTKTKKGKKKHISGF